MLYTVWDVSWGVMLATQGTCKFGNGTLRKEIGERYTEKCQGDLHDCARRREGTDNVNIWEQPVFYPVQ